MIPAHPLPQLMTDLAWLNRLEGGIFTSYDVADEEARVKAVNLALQDFDGLGDMIGETVSVQHVLIHPTDKTDEKTGELRCFQRIVIVDADGKARSCSSQGILKALCGALAITRQLPPWNPPLTGVVRQLTVSGRNRWLTIEWKPRPKV